MYKQIYTNKQLLPYGGAQNLPEKVGCQRWRNQDGSKNDPPWDGNRQTKRQKRHLYIQTDRWKDKQLLPYGGAQNLPEKVGCQGWRNHDGPENDPPHDREVEKFGQKWGEEHGSCDGSTQFVWKEREQV